MSFLNMNYFLFALILVINKLLFISSFTLSTADSPTTIMETEEIQETTTNVKNTQSTNKIDDNPNIDPIDPIDPISEDTNKTNIEPSDKNNNNDNNNDNNEEYKNDIIIYDNCEDIQPTNGILEDCIENKYQVYKGQNCCYMTIKYEYNEYNLCLRISKDKNEIKKKIKELEEEYEGCDSVDIDCYSKIINYSFVFLFIFIWL